MKGRAAPYILVASVVLAFVWFSVTRTDRPREEITAMIEGVTFGPASAGHGRERTALIRLADGTVAEARLAARENVHPGQNVRVLVYERAFAGPTYEIVEADSHALAHGPAQ